MTAPRSFRVRLLVGSLLWTGGLLALYHLASMTVFRRFPAFVRVDHATIVAIGLVFMAIGLFAVRRGLVPFTDLRSGLVSMRTGKSRRLEGDYPTELQPLVNDLNALLAQREEAVSRAIAKAGDLAHGLKTPLALLAQEAERARRDGHVDLAAAIDQQVGRMRQQVDYHLAHARASASGAVPGARCDVAESAEGIARTLRRLHAERGLTIQIGVPADHAVRVQREDLDEMLGNLIDNACKWARARVTVTSVRDADTIAIVIDDDGPGLQPSMREAVLQRGVRADEASPGSGFGLAIVRDLAAVYKGSIALDAAPGGGVRARLTLPSC